MALLNRFSKLNDRGETGIFTFIVTPSVTRDLHRDATTKDFCFGYHRWAVSFQRPTEKLLGVHLLLRNASPSTACVVDFTLTLLNREHFSQNQVYAKKQAKFTITNPMQGVSRWIQLRELTERRFSNESGEFLFELSLSNMTTIFECDVQLSAQVLGQYKQLLRSGGQPAPAAALASGSRAGAGAFEQSPAAGHKKASKGSTAGAEQPINLDTNQFTFGSFDWSLTIVPLVIPGAGAGAGEPASARSSASGASLASSLNSALVQQPQPAQQQPQAEPVCRIYLNRLSGFDSLCRVKYRVILGHHQPGGAQSAEWVDSKQLDQISDCGGRIRGFQFRATNILRLVSLRHNAASSPAANSLDLRVHIEMFCANTISEARVPLERKADEPQLANCSDRNKQAWCVEADRESGDALKLKLFFLDLQSVPRNHIRYISWIAYLVRRDPKSGQMRDSLAVRNAPHSNYYLQDGIDMGSIMDTELSVKDLNKSPKSYLDSGQITVHIEWVDSLLLFSHLYNNYDALATVQRHQISRELEALQREFDYLEGKYLQTQRALSRLAATSQSAASEHGRRSERQPQQQQQQPHQPKHTQEDSAETTSDCSDTSDSDTRHARPLQPLQNGRSSSNSEQLQLHPKQQQQQQQQQSSRLARQQSATHGSRGGVARRQHLGLMQPGELEARSSSSMSLGEQLASRSASTRARSPMSSPMMEASAEWLRRNSAASFHEPREQCQLMSQASSAAPVVRRRLPQPRMSSMAAGSATSSLEYGQFHQLASSFDQQPRELSLGHNYHGGAPDEQHWAAGLATNGNERSATRCLSPPGDGERGSHEHQRLVERAGIKLDRLETMLHTSQPEHTLNSQHRHEGATAMRAFSAGQTPMSGAFAAPPAAVARAPIRTDGSELESGRESRAETDQSLSGAHVMRPWRNDRLLDEQPGVQLDREQRRHAHQLHAAPHQDEQFASSRDSFALRASTLNYPSVSIGHYASETVPAYLGQRGDKSIEDIPLELLARKRNGTGSAHAEEAFAIGAMLPSPAELDNSLERPLASHYLERARSIGLPPSFLVGPSSSPINLARSAIDQIDQQRRSSPNSSVELAKWSHMTAGGESAESRATNEQAREQERRRLSELALSDNPITGLDEEIASIELEARLKHL